MNEFLTSLLSVTLLGMITTIQPCPLTVNISIISLITGAPYQQKHFFKTVAGFMTGYVMAFFLLALVISQGISAIAPLSIFLQGAFTAFVGPILIVVGMLLSRLINLDKFYKTIQLSDKLWLVSGAYLPSLLLGGILAMSFCPSTASIFFGVLLPISVRNEAPLIFPVAYSLGALIPLIIISLLVRRGLTGIVPKLWTKSLPQWIGWFLILLGIYMTIKEVYL